MSALASSGHNAANAYRRLVPCMDGARGACMDGARGAGEKNVTHPRNVRVQPCIRPTASATRHEGGPFFILRWRIGGIPMDPPISRTLQLSCMKRLKRVDIADRLRLLIPFEIAQCDYLRREIHQQKAVLLDRL